MIVTSVLDIPDFDRRQIVHGDMRELREEREPMAHVQKVVSAFAEYIKQLVEKSVAVKYCSK